MKTPLFSFNRSRIAFLMVAVTALTASFVVGADKEKGKAAYKIAGLWLDGCSCDAPCPCELMGLAHGCQGVGAMVLSSGSFGGQDFGEAKIAYATVPGKWVRLYVNPSKPADRAAVEAFARAAFAAFGPLESLTESPIAVSGEGGRYELTVDGGKVMKLSTEPVIGGDKKKPIAISNTQNPFVPTFLQGKTASGSFKDGEHSFTLKDSNAYFQDRVKAKGEL